MQVVEDLVRDQQIPRQDLRRRMQERGATEKEIDALIAVHARLDAWWLLGVCTSLNVSRAIDEAGLSQFGVQLSGSDLGALSLGVFFFGGVLTNVLVIRQMRCWIQRHESGFDKFIPHTLRYRASLRTLLGWTYVSLIMVLVQITCVKIEPLNVIVGALIQCLIVIAITQSVTGGSRICAPVRVDGEYFKPDEVRRRAGSEVGEFMASLSADTKAEANAELQLYLRDLRAIRDLREKRRAEGR